MVASVAPRGVAAAAGPSARPDTVSAPPARWSQVFRGPIVLGLIASTSVVVGAVIGGTQFVRDVPGDWFFGAPGGPLGSVGSSHSPSGVSLVLVYGGILLLIAAWLRLLQLLHAHPGRPVRDVVKTISVWSIPVLIGPPLFSVDLYSYAGQAELVSRHINPYLYGTGVLGGTPFNTMAGPTWANTPSPYGPLILRLDGLLATIANHQILFTLVLLRLVAVGALAVAVYALAGLAREFGRDRAQVVALGAASPLAILAFLGGAHNDLVMVAMVLVGLLVARRKSWALGIVICAAAATVKAPAFLAVIFLGWCWLGPVATWQARFRRTVLAGAIAAGTMLFISLLAGFGLHWVRTVNSASEVQTGVTPVSFVAHVVAGTAHIMGVPWSFDGFLTVFRVLGFLAAAVFATRQLLVSPRKGMQHSLGISLLVVALLLPTLWSWYLSWGLLVLAPVAEGRVRRFCIGVVAVATILGAGSNKHVAVAMYHASFGSDTFVVLGIAAVLLVDYLILFPKRRWLNGLAPGAARLTGHGELAATRDAPLPGQDYREGGRTGSPSISLGSP
ncbi:MAG TPA: polyprenol phosphomannose-dependent alpha 1,6 mannosyltransferase MptB [Acidimicrobiales bacterium]|nr:polyprenol phosphomannose-dependent alpha 1,6 mannosyltransferase MptB [Acidimicrobiales bacterium]